MAEEREVTVIESGSGMKWFFLGAALGVGLGLLFAPQPGERTRRDLVRHAKKLKSRAEEELEGLADELEERGGRMADRVTTIAGDVVDEVRDGRRRLEDHVLSAREDLERKVADRRARGRAAATADGAAEDDESDA